MYKWTLIFGVLFLAKITLPESFCQDQLLKKGSYIKLKSNGQFLSVDNHFDIIKNVVYLIPTSFIINSDIDTIRIKGRLYCIISYPPYPSGHIDLAFHELSPSGNPEFVPIESINNLRLCILKEKFDKIKKTKIKNRKWHIF